MGWGERLVKGSSKGQTYSRDVDEAKATYKTSNIIGTNKLYLGYLLASLLNIPHTKSLVCLVEYLKA